MLSSRFSLPGSSLEMVGFAALSVAAFSAGFSSDCAAVLAFGSVRAVCVFSVFSSRVRASGSVGFVSVSAPSVVLVS